MTLKDFPTKLLTVAKAKVDRMPHLPLTLGYHSHSLKVEGLLDTGASVNVLPYEIGKQLGFIWENETLSVILAGNLAQFEALLRETLRERAVVVDAQVGSFPTINLAFAWTQATNVPLILGQANFFFEFDVCFFRARSEFEIRPKRVG